MFLYLQLLQRLSTTFLKSFCFYGQFYWFPLKSFYFSAFNFFLLNQSSPPLSRVPIGVVLFSNIENVYAFYTGLYSSVFFFAFNSVSSNKHLKNSHLHFTLFSCTFIILYPKIADLTLSLPFTLLLILFSKFFYLACVLHVILKEKSPSSDIVHLRSTSIRQLSKF